MDLIRVLGKGGFGEVSLVLDPSTGKLYVYKKSIRGDLNIEGIALQHIKPECNPYLVCIHQLETNEEGKVTGIYLDYVPNTFELKSYIRLNPGTLTFYSKFIIMMRLLEGLAVLHSLDVIHRDIKPENMLINPNTLEVRYIDFGFSCTKVDEACRNRHSWSHYYVAPEIIDWYYRGPTPTWEGFKKADVWSLGLTFMYICFPEFQSKFYVAKSIPELYEEILDMGRPSKRLIALAFPTPEEMAQPDPQKMVFVTIISMMLVSNPANRPSARIMLKFLRKDFTNDVLKISKLFDPVEIERKAIRSSENIVVNPRTKIFPGQKRSQSAFLP